VRQLHLERRPGAGWPGLPVTQKKRIRGKDIMLNLEEINNMYKDIYIKKSEHKYRHIQAPNETLKKEQYKMLNRLRRNRLPISPKAYGFVEGKSIFDNALNHINKECILNIDLKDFFDGISRETILNKLNEFNIRNAEYISYVCTRNEHLVQGSPTSPFISNIIFYEMDNLLDSLALENNLTYSRYADDMTFSGNAEDIIKIKKDIFNNILNNGYKISWEKVEIRFSNQRQEVTGIVVNEKANIKKPIRNRIRGICHSIERDINNGNIKTEEDLITNYGLEITRFKGYLNFLRNINNSFDKYYQQFDRSVKRIQDN
jgi:hypothetical protein